MAYINYFFFNDTATTEIYTLSLHDALPILTTFDRVATRSRRFLLLFLATSSSRWRMRIWSFSSVWRSLNSLDCFWTDRKSTRLNSSHANISYAVFCLKKKNTYFSILVLFFF